jgi:hypothetical protein
VFTQKFRSRTSDDVIEITWKETGYGAFALAVAGIPRSFLNEETKRWADLACGQRMGEVGEHAEEPE